MVWHEYWGCYNVIGNYTKQVKAEQYKHPSQMQLIKITPCTGTHAHYTSTSGREYIIQDKDYVILNLDKSIEILNEGVFKQQYNSIDCNCDH